MIFPSGRHVTAVDALAQALGRDLEREPGIEPRPSRSRREAAERQAGRAPRRGQEAASPVARLRSQGRSCDRSPWRYGSQSEQYGGPSENDDERAAVVGVVAARSVGE